jgi:DNA-binding beta-propeller fold protein YncE
LAVANADTGSVVVANADTGSVAAANVEAVPTARDCTPTDPYRLTPTTRT